MATDENLIVHFAQLEFESLRGTEFGKIPFVLTSEPGHLEEVPDYFNDLAISQKYGGNCLIIASGDLTNGTTTYERDYAFDGKRANVGTKWIGATNALAWKDTGGGPSGGGPSAGGGPVGGGPSGGPIGGGEFAPPDYQYIYCAFPTLTKISRILYDNRFNVTEVPGAQPGDFDYLPHLDDIWQRNFEFFWSDKVLGYGEIYDPWRLPPQLLAFQKDKSYGSSGVHLIFDNPSSPLEAGIIGVHNIDTYADFDKNFHWPYVSEIEAYGFGIATAYVEAVVCTQGQETLRVVDRGYVPKEGEQLQFDNVIMYFPNYLGSGFDMGRRTYVIASSYDEALVGHRDLIHVVLEFYPTSNLHKDPAWQKNHWWLRDTQELGRFETSFYRDVPTRVDTLPNLRDLPAHMVYDNNEDLKFPFSVPGATAIRAHFSVFDLEPTPGTDEVTVEDPDGNVYMGPGFGNDFALSWTPWVPGDTIVIHFKSNGSLNSYDSNYNGFVVDVVEVKSIETE